MATKQGKIRKGEMGISCLGISPNFVCFQLRQQLYTLPSSVSKSVSRSFERSYEACELVLNETHFQPTIIILYMHQNLFSTNFVLLSFFPPPTPLSWKDPILISLQCFVDASEKGVFFGESSLIYLLSFSYFSFWICHETLTNANAKSQT